MRSTRCRATLGAASAVATFAVVLFAGACTKPAPGPGPGATGTPSAAATSAAASPSPSPSASTSKTPTVDPAKVFATNGIGPYGIGKSLADLDSKGLVTGLFDSPICPGVKIGESTGAYAGKLRLAFGADGKLWYIDTNATDLQTPSGGKIGMTIAALKALYGSKGTVIPKSGPNIGGLLVKVSGSTLGIVFLEDNAGKAYSMSAGPVDMIESFAKGGEGC